MADTPAAPAAPAAAPAAAPDPAGTPAKAADKPNGAARANDGRFLPKAGDPAEKPAEAAAPAEPEEEELIELKINGKAERRTKAQVIALAQKVEAADRRFQDAAAAIKKAEDLIASFEADPEAVLTKLGKDPAALIEAHLARKAKDATLSPEQRELEATKAELAKYKAQEKKLEAEKQTAAQQAQDEKTFAALEKTLLGAAKSYGMDQNPQTLEQLCDVALEAIEMGYTLTAEQCCEEVLHRQKEHITARDAKVLSKLSDEKLVEYLGPGIVDRLNRATLKRVPAPGATAKPKERKEPPPAKGYMSEAEFERSLGLRK